MKNKEVLVMSFQMMPKLSKKIIYRSSNSSRLTLVPSDAEETSFFVSASVAIVFPSIDEFKV
jgi:hypothetical protein